MMLQKVSRSESVGAVVLSVPASTVIEAGHRLLSYTEVERTDWYDPRHIVRFRGDVDPSVGPCEVPESDTYTHAAP